MRKIILSTVLLTSSLGLAAATQAADPLNYNIVNIQADATRQASNDQMICRFIY